MTITISWDIANLERETSDGYVYTVHYTITANDGTYQAGAYGSIGLERPENLIPYSSLTKAVVVGWVKDKLTAEKVADIETALENQIDEQRQPTKASGIPWNQ